MAKGFWSDFRRFFLRGLAAVLPPLLTVMIIVFVFTFVRDKLGTRIDVAVQWVSVQVMGISRKMPLTLSGHDQLWVEVRAAYETYHLWLIGFFLAFVIIYVFGRFVASWFGRSVWRMVEHTLTHTPLVNQIDPSVKQVTDFLLSEKKLAFSGVVAVEYPRKGIWSVGFVTGSGMCRLTESLGSEMLTVFVPSSPTPVTGYTITVRREEAIDLPLSIDEALRFTVSGGVLVPPAQRLDDPASPPDPALTGPDAVPADDDGTETQA